MISLPFCMQVCWSVILELIAQSFDFVSALCRTEQTLPRSASRSREAARARLSTWPHMASHVAGIAHFPSSELSTDPLRI